jgi:uncharacterized protein (TIGR00304 family)
MDVPPETFYGLGIMLIFIGIIVMLIAIILFFLSNLKRNQKIRGGGVIIVGPIPIILGTDKKSVKTLLLLSIVLVVLLIALMIVLNIVSR